METTKSATGFSASGEEGAREPRATPKRPGLGASPVRGAEEDAQALDRREDRSQVLGGRGEARDPHLLERPHLVPGVPVRRAQDEIRRERDDPLDVGIAHAADLRQTGGRGRYVAESGDADEGTAAAEKEGDLCEAGGQGDDAAGRGGESDGDAPVVRHREGEPVRRERGPVDRGCKEGDGGEEPREKTSCDVDPDAAQNGSSPVPMPCGKTVGGGNRAS